MVRVGVHVCRVLLVIPPLLLAAASVVWTIGGLKGGGLWPAVPHTISEAAATKNTGEAARLILLGEDPNRPGRVGEGLLPGGQSQVITPLEVAVAVRRASMAKMLLDYGAHPDATQLRAIRCSSEKYRDSEMHELLEGLAPDPWPQCEAADASQLH